MDVFIKEYAADLDSLYQTYSIFPGNGTGNQLLNEYISSHSQFVYDVIIEDANGRIQESSKGYPIEKVYSANRIDTRKTLLMASLENGQMCLVLQTDIPGGGAFSILINLDQYYEALIQKLRIGTNGYIVLKDKHGVILMHPEKAQWGIDVIAGREIMYPNLDLESLKGMISHQMQGQVGVEEYYSYWWLNPDYPRVRKVSAYVPVTIGEDFLILSAVMDYDDMYIPIVEGVFKLMILFLSFFLVMIAMALYMVRMMLQKQKDTEQIAYLTELNRLLEEMHRSEETIAHQQRLQIMGTMTGGIAHEFNNMLTPIMGYADLLMMDLPEDSEQYDHALEIYEAAEKAKEIIQQISSLSRKNMETAYKNTHAAKMLVRALKMVRSVCPPNISLEEHICLQQEYILSNETQINQVILNICVNAIHAIGHKDGKIRIDAAIVERDELKQLKTASNTGQTKVAHISLPAASENWEHYVQVSVSDNGCGMNQEILNQIFDPFFTTKKGGKGTGLGLALVEQIIRSHKGGLYVESEEGIGSMFCLYLPVSKQNTGKTGSTAHFSGLSDHADTDTPSSKETTDGGQAKLLIVDDNPKVLKLLEKDAAKLQISLICRMNFQEALQALEESKREGTKAFDALVAEQSISGQMAVDFYMSIQGQHPNLIKIIMADRITRELVEAKQKGILNAYIDKPVSIASILEALKSVKI